MNEIIRLTPSKTLQEHFVRALLLRGEIEVSTKSTKYRKFTRRQYATEQPKFYFIGNGGSLRVGLDIKTSIPLDDGFKYRLIVEAMTSWHEYNNDDEEMLGPSE